MEFKRANTYKAVFLFFFSRKKYIALAINHSMAINLEAQDILNKYKEGTYPVVGWENEAIKSAEEAAKQVSKGLWGAFGSILMAAIIALAVDYYLGSINPFLSINYSLFSTFIGTFLASWATLMELGGGFATWSGKALHELIHPAMFKLLFVPGVCLLFIGVAI